MAINRGPWNALIDDDGSNLTGTIWNKDKIKTVILDPTDAAIAGMTAPVSGNWTPVDASGAGLVLGGTGGRYWRLDKNVVLQAYIVYPATANGASAVMGGLPFANGSQYGGFYSPNSPNGFQVQPGAVTILIVNPATAAQKTNAQMSGIGFVFTGSYLTD